jgi:hypothetical protein
MYDFFRHVIKLCFVLSFNFLILSFFIFKNDVSRILKHFQYGVFFLHRMAVTKNSLLTECVNGRVSCCFATRAEVTLLLYGEINIFPLKEMSV